MLNFIKYLLSTAVLFLGVAFIFGSSLDFKNCVNHYSTNNPGAENLKESIATFVKMIPAYRHCVGDYVTTKHDAVTAVFTIVIAIFTTVLAIFTINMAKSARIAAETARDALSKLERAFIYNGKMAWKACRGKKQNGSDWFGWTFTATWENSGSTIAHKFTNHVSFETWTTFEGDLPPEFAFVDHGKPDTGVRFVAPKGSILSVHMQVEACILEAVRVGHIRLFMWGWTTYRDIFTPASEHETQFCWELDRVDGDPYDLPTRQDEMPRIAFNFRICGRYNCADGDCNQQE